MMFKVGDRVRVTTKRHGEYQYKQEGTITDTKCDFPGLPIRVLIDSNKNGFFYSERDLELINKEIKYDPNQMIAEEDDL